METYRKYFDIDPDFFPAVNNDVIRKEPNLWKKYFPHETFIKLLKQMLDVLERKQKLNIWVEGAYGTGKSHAVLTMKRLLDASEEEVSNYFQQFNLDDDLRKKFISAKQQGKIITIHRYGSSSIHGDNDLFLAMQESIEEALNESGIDNIGSITLKKGIIKYLSDEENKRSFEVYVNGSYSELFGGQSVDEIIENLQEYTGQSLLTLMNNIYKIGKERNIKTFSIDGNMMVKWIEEVIHVNNLKAIVFIWDEFTEYFINNANNLTEFQHVLDLSQTEPFCFIPVTHKRAAGMDDSDKDKKKILGRFMQSCVIELPENMAFQLMGAAMQIKNDNVIKEEWNDAKNDMESRTSTSRKLVKEYAKIKDEDLSNILPIHPYAACMLKHISASFASNQRSMFDFIKNAGNDDNKGFQWYIDNYGPLDENPFLSIDLLWGFFYDKGKNDLSQQIRQILDHYGVLSRQLGEDEKKVLKTILILQAISENSGKSIEIFLPNEKNLNYAFEGTDLGGGKAGQCAQKLLRDNLIHGDSLRGGPTIYSVSSGERDENQIANKKKEYKRRNVSNLIQDGQLNESIVLPHDLKLRFKMFYVGITDFDNAVKKYISNAEDNTLYFYTIVCLSKTVSESIIMTKKIKEIRELNKDSEVIFIDCGKIPLGEGEFDTWADNMATSSYYAGKDNSLSTQYNNYAKQVLLKWRDRIVKGPFVLYAKDLLYGNTIHNLEDLGDELRAIDAKRFPLALECHFKSINGWWESNSLLVGVECGVTRTLKGTYNSNNANLRKALEFAWEGDEYWKSLPSEPISRIKAALEDFIQNTLKSAGRISIVEIYNFLSSNDFGFLPCNMTAFFIGFLLKEYVNDKYSWSDGISSDSMSLKKMKEMVEEIIKIQITPDTRYREKFIVTMTNEEKAFIEGTAEAFDIPKSDCSSIESVRDQVRCKMKDSLSFPILILTKILDELPLTAPKNIIGQLLTDYQNLANNTTSRSDSDIANRIGNAYLCNTSAASDLYNILSHENCKKGMLKYLGVYRGGELKNLALKIKDGGQYINELRHKFDAGDANWLWKMETVDQQIDIVILEYHIAVETSKILGDVHSYSGAIEIWNEKTSNIKIALESIKKHAINVLPLLSILKEIKVEGELKESKKESFLDYLKNYGNDFNDFYTNQFDLFKLVCNYYLQDLSDYDKDKIFKRVPSGMFVLDNVTYSKKVEEIVTEYKKGLGSLKLKNLWKEKTETDSPYKWSEKYRLPILIMVSDNEQAECRTIFKILNDTNSQSKDIEKALRYLENFTHWNELQSSSNREKAFREKILGDKSILIPNLDELKEYISKNSSESPYFWFGNSEVEKRIKEFAQAQYDSKGLEMVMESIDNMDADEVKKYLKDLIREDMNVGTQILKTLI